MAAEHSLRSTLVLIAMYFISSSPAPSTPVLDSLQEAIEDRIGAQPFDASEFFGGSKPRPRLEIMSPVNGQVLDEGEVFIQLRVAGYGFPSSLHDSKVCVGLASRGARVEESCFDQSLEAMAFHASNLEPGESYMLRVVLFEKNQALAVSVRSFRVAGVALPPPPSLPALGSGSASVSSSSSSSSSSSLASSSSSGSGGLEGAASGDGGARNVVSIQTALQLAMAQQSRGDPGLAGQIYQEILERHPQHADALHLMGLVYYQKGDPEAAVGLIERALRCALSEEPNGDPPQTTFKAKIPAGGPNQEAPQPAGLAPGTGQGKSRGTESAGAGGQPSAPAHGGLPFTLPGPALDAAGNTRQTTGPGTEATRRTAALDSLADSLATSRHSSSGGGGGGSGGGSSSGGGGGGGGSGPSSSLGGEGGGEGGVAGRDASPGRRGVANFHNSLGECLRAAGRSEEAAHHFKQASAIEPNLLSAKFNLALTYQQLNYIDQAAALYGEVASLALGALTRAEESTKAQQREAEHAAATAAARAEQAATPGAPGTAPSPSADSGADSGASPGASPGAARLVLGSSTKGAKSGTVQLQGAPGSAEKETTEVAPAAQARQNGYPRIHPRVHPRGGAGGEKEGGDPSAERLQVRRRLWREVFEATEDMILEAKVRECDLLTTSEDLGSARLCWLEGLLHFPESALMHSELGGLLLTLGDLPAALRCFEMALKHGMASAEVNVAAVLELEGQSALALERLQSALGRMRRAGLPSRHVEIKLATVLPRVMPSFAELEHVRSRVSAKLDELLETGHLDMSGDTSEPLHQGFGTGFHLGFHGQPNRHLKTKLARVYLSYCPPLATGVFMSTEQIMTSSALAITHTQKAFFEDADFLELPQAASRAGAEDGSAGREPPSQQERQQGPKKRRRRVAWDPSVPIRVGWVSRFFHRHAVGYLCQGVIRMLPRPKFKVLVFKIEGLDSSHAGFGGPDASGGGLSGLSGVDEVSQHIELWADDVFTLPASLNAAAEIVRQQKLDVLIYPEVGMDPVAYFLAFARLAPAQAAWWGHPDTTGIAAIDYFVSSEIEVPGADAAYSERLVRLKGLGAYFFRPQVSARYAQMMQPKGSRAEKGGAAPGLLAPPTAAPNATHSAGGSSGGSQAVGLGEYEARRLAMRREIQRALGLPEKDPMSGFRLYLCPAALFKLHPNFDEALLKILDQDPKAYLLLLEGRDRAAWAETLVKRLLGNSGGGGPRQGGGDLLAEQRSRLEARLIFFDPHRTAAQGESGGGGGGDSLGLGSLWSLYEAADVVLDPFPVSGYITSLQALSVGAAVVTLPGSLLGGRLTLALYARMGLDREAAKQKPGSERAGTSGGGSSGPRQGRPSLFASRDAARRRSAATAEGRGGAASASGSAHAWMVGLEDLVAIDERDYVKKALAVANLSLEERSALRELLVAKAGALFEDGEAVTQWDALLTKLAEEHAR